MPKYIRTKDGEVFTVVEKIDKTKFNRSFKYLYLIKEVEKIDNSSNIIVDVNVVKEADTIEELICDDDILYIYDLYPDAVLVVEGNIKPFGYNTAIKLKEWLEYKPKFDLFIKDNRGNYIKTAKMNEKGCLELL